MQPEKANKKSIKDKESEILQFWQDNNIFEKSVAKPGKNTSNNQSFTFYDGPPFATGLPHNGHLLISSIKDAVARYNTMQGKSVRRVWGWDCHGLPIEELIEKKFDLKSKKDIENFGIKKFTEACEQSVFTYEEEWKKVIPRIGRFVDMENAYKTMDFTFTESVWWAWKQIYDKGYVYEGYKIMHICPRCETTLSQNEVSEGYKELTDLSATVKFKSTVKENTYFLAWTTTPWTLPGNTALAMHQDIEYVEFYKVDEKDTFYIASRSSFDKLNLNNEYKIREISDAQNSLTGTVSMMGTALEGQSYIPPFEYYKNADLDNKENAWKVWAATFVNDESGTGIVHIAPAFGEDDYKLSKEKSIPLVKHIKFNGEFEAAVTDFAGKKVKTKDDNIGTDIEIIKWLAHNHLLFSKQKIVHSYPTCWRCKTPLLNYATSSWFIDVPKVKNELIEENQKINWVPAHIKDGRFGKWLEGAREWSVSRSRYWGAPMPIWRSVDGAEIKVAGSLGDIAQKPKNKYIFVRHGEAKSNVLNILDSGSMLDNHLTERGVAQATDTADKLDGDFDMIFSSPLIRARETATILAKGKEIIFDDRLREHGMGVMDLQSRSNYVSACRESQASFFDFKVNQGESHRESQRRVSNLLLELEDKYENKKIIIVTHGGPALAVFLWANSFESGAMNEVVCNDYLYLKNAEVRELDWKKVSYDDKCDINLHRPYIDQIKMKDSRGVDMLRIPDVFDCWFESGAMPFAQMHYPFENKELFDRNYPADFIAEALDQTRGWFYSLLVLNKMIFDKSPYKNVVTSGLLMAADGQKMSKSLRNYTDPMELVDKYGADALRFALLSTSATHGENTPFSDAEVDEVYKKNISRLENVLQFYSLYREDDIEASNASNDILDKWMFSRIFEAARDVSEGFENYELDAAMKPIDKLIDDLSTWYLRRSRERLKSDSKREALSAFRFILLSIAKIISPSMPFLAERIYKEVGGELESVHLESWLADEKIDARLLSMMLKTRDLVNKSLVTRQMNSIKVRQPLALLKIKDDTLTEEMLRLIKEELNVLEVLVDRDMAEEVYLDTAINEDLKKLGDKRELLRAVQDIRKAKNLTHRDLINLTISGNAEYLVEQDFMDAAKIAKVTRGESLSYSLQIDDKAISFDIELVQ